MLMRSVTWAHCKHYGPCGWQDHADDRWEWFRKAANQADASWFSAFSIKLKHCPPPLPLPDHPIHEGGGWAISLGPPGRFHKKKIIKTGYTFITGVAESFSLRYLNESVKKLFLILILCEQDKI